MENNNTHELVTMIYQLVDIIQYDNAYAFQLLKQITCGRRTMIELDGCKVFVEAVCSAENEYYLAAHPGSNEAMVQFKTTSRTLRKIMAGLITLDTAVVQNEIYVQGEFEDIINMHRLTTFFLSEGPLNVRLRNLWEHFNNSWNNTELPLAITPLENQKPVHGNLLAHIPEDVLLIRL